LYLIEKSGEVAAEKELGGNETSTATGARERLPQADHYIDLTRGIGRTFDVFPEGL